MKREKVVLVSSSLTALRPSMHSVMLYTRISRMHYLSLRRILRLVALFLLEVRKLSLLVLMSKR